MILVSLPLLLLKTKADRNTLAAEAYAALWTRLEPPLATIAACLPFLARIFSRKVVTGIRNMTNRTRTKKTSQQSGDRNVKGGQTSRYKTLPGSKCPPVSMNPRNDIYKSTTTTASSIHGVEDNYELGLLSPTVTTPRKTLQPGVESSWLA